MQVPNIIVHEGTVATVQVSFIDVLSHVTGERAFAETTQINVDMLSIEDMEPKTANVARCEASSQEAVHHEVHHTTAKADEHSFGLSISRKGVVSWRDNSPDHPRNWPRARKTYDIAVVVMLEFFT
jgi:hypothetical protein